MSGTNPRLTGLTAPFLLQGNGRLWRVVAGAVDVFLVDLRGGEAAGARSHVFRVPAGEAFFGLPPEARDHAGLLASPLPGAVIEAAAVETLAAAELLPLVENWIDRVSRALTAQALPSPARWLEPGAVESIDDTGDSIALVRTTGALCWLSHRAGESAYLGLPELSVNGSGWFPLSGSAWLESRKGSVLEAVDSTAWRKADPPAAGLDEFHRIAMQVLLRRRAEVERKERDRLSVAVEREAGVVSSALRRLAAPLERTADRDAEEEGSDPLLSACRAVGEAMGIRILAPPGNLSRRGVLSVESIARASGVRLRRVALRGKWWREDAGPMLAFRAENNRPVALLRKRRRYRVWDPAEQATTRAGRGASAELAPFAWVFYRPFPDRALGLLDLLEFALRGARRDLTAIIGAGIGSGLLAVLTPLATGLIFDRLIPGADRRGITLAAAFLAVAAVVGALFQLTSNYAVLRMEGRMEAETQAAVWDRLLGLPVPFFRDFDSGDLAMRSLGIGEIRAALTGSALSSVLSGIFSVFSLALMFYYSWALALVGVGLCAVAFAVPTFAGATQLRRLRVLSAVRGRISGMLLQFLGGIAKLRVTGKERRAFTAWAGEFTLQKREAVAARTLSNLLAVFNAGFPLLATAVIFAVNSSLGTDTRSGALSTGEFLAFYAAFFGFLSAGLDLSDAVVSVLGIVPLFERAAPILKTLPEVSPLKTSPGKLTGALEISHVSFRYRPDLPLVLKDVSLKVRAGEFVAIAGASGSGKSTLFRLLLGFETPESGAIHFDGQDLAGLDLPEVRRQIGVVLQDGKLQTGDIFENITGALPLTMDDAWEAARLAGLEADIQAMPMGMHTVLAEGGGGLSGGQRQRLMIARAIAARPRLLLFDEATSALDNQTQAAVSRSLEALQAARIVIAHRLSTIVKADRIYVMDAGTVAEAGTYQELLSKNGLFARLAQRQLI